MMYMRTQVAAVPAERPQGDESWGAGYGIFPLLITKLDSGVYGLNPLPELHPDILYAVAERFADSVGLPVRLSCGNVGLNYKVPAADYGIELEGCFNSLLIANPFPLPSGLCCGEQRERELRRFLESVEMDRPVWAGRAHYVYSHQGDHGQNRFAGRGVDGVPTGLSRCKRCREWRGVLATLTRPTPENITARPEVADVLCRCASHNRCPQCRKRLARYALGSLRYDEALGQAVYVPGVMGLGHRCRGVPEGRRARA